MLDPRYPSSSILKESKVSFSPVMPAGRTAQVSMDEGAGLLAFRTSSSANPYTASAMELE